MPPANNSDLQTQTGQSPLSQSPQNIGAEHTRARSKKKAKKAAAAAAAAKDSSPPDTVPFPEDLLSASPPQAASRFPKTVGEGFSGEKYNVKSPVLDALSQFDSDLGHVSTSKTKPWAEPLSFVSSSPPDPPQLEVAAESPPPVPVESPRPAFSSATPPKSPQQRKARPVSYGGQSTTSRQHSSEKSIRYSGVTPPFMHPPLPHLPQAHFYGAPEIDLGIRGGGSTRWDDDTVHFMTLDNIYISNARGSITSHQCLLIGSSGKLDVLVVDEEKLKPAGSLACVHGDTLGAAVLTLDATPASLTSLAPLVAVISHGPVIADQYQRYEEPGTSPDDNEAVPAEQIPSQRTINAKQYQTRLEIFSLVSQDLVSTLFVSQSTPSLPSFRGLPTSALPAIGDLSIVVKDSYLILCSGTSGEVFVFGSNEEGFRCLAKLWTTIQAREIRKYSSSSNSADSDVSPVDSARGQTPCALPLFSLSGRWLALVPPSSPSRSSIHGIIPESLIEGRVSGLEAMNAPAKPPITCILESPDADSILNRVARGVAKEVVKGAKWLGEQGLQTWNSYWNKDASPPLQQNQSGRYHQQPEPVYPPGVFPPTHAPEARVPSDEPEIVSIYDLRQLSEDQGRRSTDFVTPTATFQPPGGCSFVSFSPTGLSLLTAGKKGDAQYIWDLMQIHNTRVASLVSSSPSSVDGDTQDHSPRVRQIAKYNRLSSSSIVDVVWTNPLGDRFAMLTRNGTVHVFDLPQSAFQWPPPRRVFRQQQSPSLSPSRASDSDSTGGVFASAMKYAGKTQPMLANLRGRTPSIGGTLGGMSATGVGFASATGMRSGKAVAAGLSKSVGAATDTVSHLRHAGANRVHLNGLARDPMPGKVIWIQVKGQTKILAMDTNSLRFFKIRKREAAGKQSQKVKVSVIDSRNIIDTKIPSIEQLPHPKHSGFWSLPTSSTKRRSALHSTHPLSRAEIETNAPYQPFHSDKRVNLFIYKSANPSSLATEINLMGDSFASSSSQLLSRGVDSTSPQRLASRTSAGTPWIFGDDIPATKITLHSATDPSSDDDDHASNPGPGQGSTIIRQAHSAHHASIGDEALVNQIVITTRRKKNKGGSGQGAMVMAGADGMGMGEDDGFFEDDCEVLDWAGDRV